ncbi:MAG: IS1595 family transposase [Novosphingobium sp.]|nr:IS1595 family transposase [Novosphingobium sp.]
MSNLSAPHFHDEEAAYAYVEARIWPQGPVCPHCGGVERLGKLKGKSTRVGVWKCYQCRKPFTVKIGTIFEDSKVPMRLWLQAMYLIAGSKKGISSNQLHRILGVTLKTAWFMSHRIREAMAGDDGWPLGGLGKVVEADETFIGTLPGREVKTAYFHKMKILALVERGGRSRAMVVDSISIPEIQPILLDNVRRQSKLHTDEAPLYKSIGRFFFEHNTVRHMSGEFGRGPVHTNTIEGYFSIFKRGMKGIYQHCSHKHLHRYVAEFNFRYSNRVALGYNDTDRADNLLRGIIGKRLTYQTTGA